MSCMAVGITNSCCISYNGGVGVRYELLFVADVIGSIFWALCFSVIAYQLCQDLPRSAIMEPSSSLPGKCSDQKETRKRGCLPDFLAVFVGVSVVPIIVVYISRRSLPFSARFSLNDGQKHAILQ